ncbi:hypothetical protein C8Q76DRAFT_633842 [Earliella scabrosa]|nr:hypothetical protein C8Q76DRAFT_633842 [Earliella scabrosa]
MFLRHLTEHRAVVGGVAALSFVLRDVSVQCDVLQVFVGNAWYHDFVSALSQCPANSGDIRYQRPTTVPRHYSAERDVIGVTAFYLKNGRRIIVYRSSIVSACGSLTRSPATAFMNFFTEHSFGCAYPSLTLRRRSLLRDLRHVHLTGVDYITLATILHAGFQLAASPAAWPEVSGMNPSVGGPLPPPNNPCFRERFICPQQGRFFGDPGSLTDFLDPIGTELTNVNVASVPPYGPMIIWRMSSSYVCCGGCDVNDPLMHGWVVTAPLLVLPDPFPSPITTATTTRGRPLYMQNQRKVLRGRAHRSASI